MLNHPATKHRPNRGSDCGKARPGTDCAAATLLVKSRTDNRQTARHQECSPDTLNAPCDNELTNVQSGTAKCRSHGEDRDTDYKHQTAPKQVAERTSDQYQRS